ncbi:MAG: hypothetical protein H7338_06055 [Candidatus Sericytochromatia bacterium]|nr:hypothetical protein [Candidatus Sericytochromatia bacterium]
MFKAVLGMTLAAIVLTGCGVQATTTSPARPAATEAQKPTMDQYDPDSAS